MLLNVIDFITTYPQLVGGPCILVYAAVAIVTGKANRKKYEMLLLAAAFVFMAPLIVQGCLHYISFVRPLRLDLYIYHIDGLMGFEPSFAVGRLLEKHLSFTICVGMAYNAIGLVMLIVFWLYLGTTSNSKRFA